MNHFWSSLTRQIFRWQLSHHYSSDVFLSRYYRYISWHIYPLVPCILELIIGGPVTILGLLMSSLILRSCSIFLWWHIVWWLSSCYETFHYFLLVAGHVLTLLRWCGLCWVSSGCMMLCFFLLYGLGVADYLLALCWGREKPKVDIFLNLLVLSGNFQMKILAPYVNFGKWGD